MAQQTFDKSARKFHQLTIVALVVLAYVVQGPVAVALVAFVGAVMLVGRFWWPADIFRQLAWRVLEPAGILPRRDVVEDHGTRRVARIIGGVAFLAGAALLATDALVAGWAITALVGALVVLDGAIDI